MKVGIEGAFKDLAGAIMACFDNLEDGTNKKNDTMKKSLNSIKDMVENIEKVVKEPKESQTDQKTSSGDAPRVSKPSPPRSSTSAAPPPSSNQQPPMPAHQKKKKSSYLKKPKVLVVGDSLAHSANFSNIEMVTKSRVKTIKAYSSIRDTNARYPNKNFTDVTSAALVNTQEEDDFSYLVLSAPTVDISNMDTSKLRTNDNIEVYKQKAISSCQNMFAVAQAALTRHPQLNKVVILEHSPRHDTNAVDPIGLKPKLAKYANSSFAELWHSSALKDRIMIGKHNLECSGDQLEARYRDDWSGRYDGVHLYGTQGKDAYSSSLCQIIRAALSTSHSTFSTSPFSSTFHSSCPQTLHQESQKQKTSQRSQKDQDIYNVPVSNQFDILGN